MAIVTISRGSYTKGKEIAEKVAEKLGYECCSRDVLLEASEEFNIPEIRLVRALHDAPSVLERFTHGKERYVAFIQQALLELLRYSRRLRENEPSGVFRPAGNGIHCLDQAVNIGTNVRQERTVEQGFADFALQVVRA